jgi:23S rRNA pseudouridine2605 synthase
MRINKFVAQSTGLSRRAADRAITEGRVSVNRSVATLGDSVAPGDVVALDKRTITPAVKPLTIMLNKPPGYVSSRQGQGSQTIYDLLPAEYHSLKPVGRLDKDSSGLLLLTNDGDLANRLTHPRYAKTKVYEIKLDKGLAEQDYDLITRHGVELEDGLSKFELDYGNDQNLEWTVTMREGRNRQIRRTFAALGYTVNGLHRINFGPYKLQGLPTGHSKDLSG